MEKIRRILFPTDCSPAARNAFRFVLQFANTLNVPVQIVHVVYPEAESLDYPVLIERATEEKIKVARQSLRTFTHQVAEEVRPLLDHAPQLRSSIEIGGPVAQIIQTAKRDDIDLIVMGTAAHHNRFDKLFGSVASVVVAKAPCHVLIIPEEATYQDLEVVAYATDFRKTDPFTIWETGRLLSPVKSTFHCVHINTDAQKGSDTAERMEELKAYFHGRIPPEKIYFHHLPGASVIEEMNDFIDDYDIHLLTMFRPQRSFLQRLFHRSKTKQMALHARVPLLIIKD